VIVWEDYKVVGSWPGYITAYVLIAMGIYLLSDIDLLQYNEANELLQELNLGRFFHAIEEDFSRAKLESHLSVHQLTISTHARRQGLKRGNSDPELGSSTHLTSKRTVDKFLDSLEDSFRASGCAGSEQIPEIRRKDSLRLSSLHEAIPSKSRHSTSDSEDFSDFAEESVSSEEDDLSHYEEGVSEIRRKDALRLSSLHVATLSQPRHSSNSESEDFSDFAEERVSEEDDLSHWEEGVLYRC
jgi:hypothetical protein